MSPSFFFSSHSLFPDQLAYHVGVCLLGSRIFCDPFERDSNNKKWILITSLMLWTGQWGNFKRYWSPEGWPQWPLICQLYLCSRNPCSHRTDWEADRGSLSLPPEPGSLHPPPLPLTSVWSLGRSIVTLWLVWKYLQLGTCNFEQETSLISYIVMNQWGWGAAFSFIKYIDVVTKYQH